MPFRFRRSLHIAPGIRLNVVRWGLFRFRCRIRLAPGIRWNIGQWGLLRFRRSFHLAPGIWLILGRRGPFRYRHSFRIAPGIRLNIGKHGLSTSRGGRGPHVTSAATPGRPSARQAPALRQRHTNVQRRHRRHLGRAAARCCRHDGAVVYGRPDGCRYKPPPRKRTAVALAGPAIVTPPIWRTPTTPPVTDEPDGRSISGQCRKPDQAGSCRKVDDRHHDQPQEGRGRREAREADGRGGGRAGPVTRMPVPKRHRRTHGNKYPLSTGTDGTEAIDETLNAFPSWFLRRMRSLRPIRDIIARMRHDGCGGRAEKAELLTGIEGVSSRPVRKIVLL